MDILWRPILSWPCLKRSLRRDSSDVYCCGEKNVSNKRCREHWKEILFSVSGRKIATTKIHFEDKIVEEIYVILGTVITT
jgi:hypothetical protein